MSYLLVRPDIILTRSGYLGPAVGATVALGAVVVYEFGGAALGLYTNPG